MMQGDSAAASKPKREGTKEKRRAVRSKAEEKEGAVSRGVVDLDVDRLNADIDVASESSETPGPEEGGEGLVGEESSLESKEMSKIEVRSVSSGSISTSGTSNSSSRACEEEVAKTASPEDSERAGTDSDDGQESPFFQTIAGGPSPQAAAKVQSEENGDSGASKENDGENCVDDDDGATEDDGKGEQHVQRKEGSSVKISAEDLLGIIQNTPTRSTSNGKSAKPVAVAIEDDESLEPKEDAAEEQQHADEGDENVSSKDASQYVSTISLSLSFSDDRIIPGNAKY